MNSIDILKKKVVDLENLANEVEDLGIKILEGASIIENYGEDSIFRRWDKLPQDLKLAQREAVRKYQRWYNSAHVLIKEYIPQKEEEFLKCYESVIDMLQLRDADWVIMYSSVTKPFSDNLEIQIGILLSIPDVADVKELSLRRLISTDVAIMKIEEAEVLFSGKHQHAAESVAGVAIEVFFSYAPEDNALRENLLKQLAALKRKGIIATWSDCDVRAGSELEKETHEHLNSAQIILLLVSSDFIASDYCYGKEMVQAMDRHTSGEARVIPIILRPVHWKETPLGKLQVLPRNERPVTEWHDLDSAFYSVAEGIHQAIKDLLTKQLLDEGKRYYDQGLYEQAWTVFEQIVSINPECAEAFNWQGNIFDRFAYLAYTKAKEYEELSQQAYEKVLQLGGSPAKNREGFYREIDKGNQA